MRIPERPPDLDRPCRFFASPEAFLEAHRRGDHHQRAYLHWDELRRRRPPRGLTREQWWSLLKFDRGPMLQVLPSLKDKHGRPFHYVPFAPMIQQHLHRMDQQSAGSISVPEPILHPATRNRYVVSSLTEEAIRSSQLEGAATTRRVAKEMIRSGRPPRTRDERMILNNYRAMRSISRIRAAELTPDLVFALHQELTEGTLDPGLAGRFRPTDEYAVVSRDDNTTLHRPPRASELEDRLDALCDFANGKTPDEWIHPVVRAIVLHFWLAYDHPFADGNGRCARALFYWSMLHQGYWLFEFVTISSILRRQPAKYSRAFLYTETDDNDLTYFLVYNLLLMEKGVEALYEYLERKAQDRKALESLLRDSDRFNHRQRALLGNALHDPDARYTFKSHQRSHGIVRQTARLDLLRLVEEGLLTQRRVGREMVFRPVQDLAGKLRGA